MLFDFEVHFPNANSGGFLKEWPSFSSRINNLLKESYNKTISTGWSSEIEEVLALLKIP